MRTFQGIFLVLMVVPVEDAAINITGFLNEDVLLPCSCENVTVTEDIKWQKQTQDPEIVWFNKNNDTIYTGRIETFINEATSNCSILLKNITQKDNGTYKCIFSNPLYSYTSVTLHVYDPNKTSMESSTEPDGLQVFTCNSKNRHNITELQWTSKGKTIFDNITITSSKLTDGTFSFNSTLRTNQSSPPQCTVKIRSLGSLSSISENNPLATVPLSIISILVVLGFGFLAVYMWKRHRKKFKDIGWKKDPGSPTRDKLMEDGSNSDE